MCFSIISNLTLATQPSDSAPNKTSTKIFHRKTNLMRKYYQNRFFLLDSSAYLHRWVSLKIQIETTTPTDLLQLKRFRNYFHVEQET